MTAKKKKAFLDRFHPLGEIDKAWKECLDLITTERREMIPGREAWDQYAGRLRSLAVCAKHYAEAIEEYLQETALMWEKLTDDGGIHDKENKYNWADATAVKVAALNSAVYAGHSDWRLPTRGELLSAVDDDGFLPSYYWSSSIYVNIPMGVWAVKFFDGYTYAFSKTNYNYVRAVRRGA